MATVRRYNHPFRLLLYLEWILLGIALLLAITPPRFAGFPPGSPRPPAIVRCPPSGSNQPLVAPALPRSAFNRGADPCRPRPRRERRRRRFLPGLLASIIALGLVGLKLPVGASLAVRSLYTTLGFGLSWLAAFFGGIGTAFFPVLLLVVVVRGCMLFTRWQRVVMALVAYGSFLLLLILRLQFLGRAIARNPRFGFEDELSESVQPIVLSLTLYSSLLFGLVILFVLLLVGALLTEKQSRQELARTNQRLRQYALLVEDQAILQERNRIAREIHDSVGHNLTAQSIQLENAAMFLPSDRHRTEHYLNKARELGTAALRDVRQSVATLRSHPLTHQSLEAALTQLIQHLEQHSSIRVTSQVHLSHPPEKDVAIALYRVVQEAFTNIVRHSEATQVNLALQEKGSCLRLQIDDNGHGFDPRQNTTGFGLQGMRERVDAVGGTLTLRSESSQGCTITVEIPRVPRHDSTAVSG